MAVRIRRRGLVRLWVVLSVIWTVGASTWAYTDLASGWAKLNVLSYEECSSAETRMRGQTYEACLDRAGVHQSVFQREHTTAANWSTGALAIALAIDLVVTALLLVVFYVGRWVVLGFIRP